ncbi:hypothetical protein [Streptomyces sp. E-08]|uniref:hypothetical protein n=1 Tax=Streptomyces sp. E-08 TaxID=3404047 RepID=UPI003CF9949A
MVTDDGGPGMRGLLEIAVWWAVLTATTAVLVSTVSAVELLVAAVAALGAAFAARRMRLAVGEGPKGGAGAARALVALPGSVVRGLGRPAGRPAQRNGRRDGRDGAARARAARYVPDGPLRSSPRRRTPA